MIARENLYNSIQHTLEHNRIVALIGPRQCGKTTLARQFGMLSYPLAEKIKAKPLNQFAQNPTDFLN